MSTTDTGSMPFYGMYKGICVNDTDPEGLFRITALVPQVFGNGTTATDWAWPCFPWITGIQLLVNVLGGTLTLTTPTETASGPEGNFTGSVTSLLRSVPTPGTGVWISFEGGDVNAPIWNGVWQ